MPQTNIRKLKKNSTKRGLDVSDMQLILKQNHNVGFLFCGIDISSKYTWVFPLRDTNKGAIVKLFKMCLYQRENQTIFVFTKAPHSLTDQ